MMRVFSLIVLSLLVFAKAARAEHTRVTYPTSIGFEAFGKGLQYSVQFDRVLSDDLVAGVGYGGTSLNDASGNDTGRRATLIPFYAHYYFAREQGSFFGMAGATLVTDSGAANGLTSSAGGLKFTSSSVLPVIGIGYEERPDTGFLFRAAAYGVLGKEYSPWFGFALGYCL